MNKTIKVEVKQVYGNERIYPACDTSNKFIKLTQSKTFNRNDINVIKSLGYDVISIGVSV
jgi:hypothetical protein